MTSTVHRQDHNRHIGINVFIILSLVAFLLVGLALSTNIQLLSFAKVKPIPKIQYQSHAVERHGAEALEIRKCLNDRGGADEIWRSFDKKTFYLWCQLPDGTWGFMAIIQDAFDRLWYDSTSFVKGDGTKGALLKYMETFGTKFNGPYPW